MGHKCSVLKLQIFHDTRVQLFKQEKKMGWAFIKFATEL